MPALLQLSRVIAHVPQDEYAKMWAEYQVWVSLMLLRIAIIVAQKFLEAWWEAEGRQAGKPAFAFTHHDAHLNGQAIVASGKPQEKAGKINSTS